jgi:ubiquinol-cytochrome c reductase iron-sulfur subunit
MTLNEKQENDAWVTCDVAGLPKGRVKRCGWTSVYRRTDKDIASVEKYESLLADPKSLQSNQPKGAMNSWRSENPDYFVFKPWAPVRGCGVQLVDSNQTPGWAPPEINALEDMPYFTERCEGRTWDTSGRLYDRKGYPPEENLIVPKVHWVSPTKVLIYGGKA